MDNENENTTEMETIIYRGSEIQAQLMGEIDGQRMWGRRDAVSVGLYRDAEGIYYLQRESHNSQDGRVTSPLFASRRAAEFDYRCIVHRIGINAAILWAVGQLGNGDPWHLRLDAADAIMEGKGYNDPNPIYWRYAENKQAAAGKGSLMAALASVAPLTMHGVTTGTLRAAARFATKHGDTVENMLRSLMACDTVGDEGDEEADNQSAVPFYRLDHKTSALMQEYLADRPDTDARDVVNGAVAFMLEEERENLATDAEFIAEAAERRLGITQKEAA